MKLKQRGGARAVDGVAVRPEASSNPMGSKQGCANARSAPVLAIAVALRRSHAAPAATSGLLKPSSRLRFTAQFPVAQRCAAIAWVAGRPRNMVHSFQVRLAGMIAGDPSGRMEAACGEAASGISFISCIMMSAAASDRV